ncbi:hypothetical protein CLV48_101641 [Cecembia rubra]|uniref:Uncharacterized protein n=1 Tax=Cecembia rubra TaxID=1485585 RepID=A0A2P8EE32_9BACT|nr:hypothetical protein CLV48_101641 [Cecembia rubra]
MVKIPALTLLFFAFQAKIGGKGAGFFLFIISRLESAIFSNYNFCEISIKYWF